ncbi:MAG: hypothetical protein KF868_13880 [Acidobacteria bacterium]|nr:hypothetical protein [Acidobacteriota bacterium]
MIIRPIAGRSLRLRSLRRSAAGCYNSPPMFTARKIPALALVLILSIGAVCAQVCDVSCIAISSRTATTSEPEQETGASGHCHQQAQSPMTPSSTSDHPKPDGDHSSDCLSHGHAAALLKSGQTSASDAFSDAPVPVADLTRTFDLSLERLIDGGARPRPDPSPPAPPRHSILRI